MRGKGRCALVHNKDYEWACWLCVTCACGAPLDIWTARYLFEEELTETVFWHVEHDGECLLERSANLNTNEAFEAGCVTGEIIKALGDGCGLVMTR